MSATLDGNKYSVWRAKPLLIPAALPDDPVVTARNYQYGDLPWPPLGLVNMVEILLRPIDRGGVVRHPVQKRAALDKPGRREIPLR
jgi:hypothetical protein